MFFSNKHKILIDNKFIAFTDLFNVQKNGSILLLLCIVPFILYWRVTGYGFVWDDANHIIKNPYFNPVNLKNLSHFWKEIYWSLYIPVSYSLWGLITKLSIFAGLDPEAPMLFHLVNILLHVINGLLVFTLLRQLIRDRWYSLIGALFFLLHPIQVETVAWVSEFRGLLSFSFGFVALYYYLKSAYFKYEEGKTKLSNRYYIYGWLFFVAAILSKPSIVVILFFAPILEYFIYQITLKKLLLRIIPYTIPVMVIIIITTTAQSGDTSIKYPLWIRPFVFCDNMLFYIKKILIPNEFAASYARTTKYISNHWWFYTTWLLILGLAGVLLRYRKNLKKVILGIILFIIGFITVSGLLKFDFQAWSNVADRYTYISMFGFAIVIAALLEQLKINRKLIFSLSVIILIGLTLLTSRQIPLWKNSFTLWDNVIKVAPREARAWLNRGLYYSSQEEYEMALSDYEKSIEFDPYYADAYYNKGLTLQKLEKYDMAIDFYNYVIELVAESPETYNNLGCINLDLKNYEEAIKNFNQCIIFNPQHEKAYFNRGIAYMNLKEYDLAMNDYNKAIELNPQYEQAIKALDIVTKLKAQIKN